MSSLAGGGGSIPGNLDLKTLEYETEEKRRLVRRRFFLVFVFFFSFLYPLLLLLLLLSFWVVHIKNKIRGFFWFFLFLSILPAFSSQGRLSVSQRRMELEVFCYKKRVETKKKERIWKGGEKDSRRKKERRGKKEQGEKRGKNPRFSF